MDATQIIVTDARDILFARAVMLFTAQNAPVIVLSAIRLSAIDATMNVAVEIHSVEIVVALTARMWLKIHGKGID